MAFTRTDSGLCIANLHADQRPPGMATEDVAGARPAQPRSGRARRRCSSAATSTCARPRPARPSRELARALRALRADRPRRDRPPAGPRPGDGRAAAPLAAGAARDRAGRAGAAPLRPRPGRGGVSRRLGDDGSEIVTSDRSRNSRRRDPEWRRKNRAPGKAAKEKSRKRREKPKRNQKLKPLKKRKPPKKAANAPITGLDKSVEQFRESLEHSVTLSRDRLQEVVDDAVKRGRMTRGDAEKMVSDLVKRGRRQTDSPAEGARTTGQTGAQRGRRHGPSRSANRRPRQRGARAKNWASWRRAARPRPGRAAASCSSSRSTRSPSAAAASPGSDGLVVFVAGAPAGRPRAGRGDQGEAPLRRGAGGRAAAARRRPGRRPLRPRRRALPGRAVAGARLRAPARAQARPGRRGAAADRRPRRLRAGGDRAGAGTVALPQQARVLLRRARGRADPRLPRPRPLGPDRRRRGLPARLRARQRGPQRGPRLGARWSRCPPTTGASGEGILRNLVVREGRRTGQIQTRLVTSPAALPETARRPAHRDRGATRAAPTGRPARSARSACARSSAGCDFEMSHSAFFQTNTEMAERLYAVAAEYAGAERRRAALRPLLRDRHDRPDDGRPRRRGLGTGAGPARRSPTPRPTPSATGSPTPASSPAAPAPALRPLVETGRQARRRRHRPAPRRPLAEDRPAGDRVRGEADRLRLLQPDHARPQRRPAGRGRL